MMNPDYEELYAEIVEKAREDEMFKVELLTDPAKVLAEKGVRLPSGLTLCIHENTQDTVHLVLPFEDSDELDDDALDGVSGGMGNSHNAAGGP